MVGYAGAAFCMIGAFQLGTRAVLYFGTGHGFSLLLAVVPKVQNLPECILGGDCGVVNSTNGYRKSVVPRQPVGPQRGNHRNPAVPAFRLPMFQAGQGEPAWPFGSTPLKVCHNGRIYSHRVFSGLAGCGKTPAGWFHTGGRAGSGRLRAVRFVLPPDKL